MVKMERKNPRRTAGEHRDGNRAGYSDEHKAILVRVTLPRIWGRFQKETLQRAVIRPRG